MSIGTDLLSAIVYSDDRNALSQINREWLTDDEATSYDFIREHLRQHAVMPTDDTLNRAGVRLPHPDDVEPANYYLGELPRRAIHARFREQLPEVAEMLEQRNIDPLLASMREMLEFATFTSTSTAMANMRDETVAIMDEFRSRRFQTAMAGVPTGYPVLDDLTDGYIGGDLIALVGRPSVGKSYLLFNKANQAWAQGKSVLVVTMEMLVRQCSRRFISLNTGISPDAVKRGHVSSWIEDEFFASIGGLDGRPSLNFMAGDFRKTVADVDIMVQELMPDVVYVDSAYLMQPSTQKRRSSRREYINDTFEELKGIAMNRDIPVVCSTQFNREVKAKTKVLDLSMIAESDAIGQLVSVALGVKPGQDMAGKYVRNVSLMKNREGDTAEFDTHFRFSPMNFSEIGGSKRELGAGLGSDERARRNSGIAQGYED